MGKLFEDESYNYDTELKKSHTAISAKVQLFLNRKKRSLSNLSLNKTCRYIELLKGSGCAIQQLNLL
jgi:hypothetical protein